MTNFLETLNQYENMPVAIAVSGGMDSMFLMHHVAKVLPHATVLHVNHGLRTTATNDAKLAADTAKKLGLNCVILEWIGDKPTTGVEAAARTARYRLMTDWCHANNVPTLMIAHQSDDQIETFLMHLARGSGIYGLGGIRQKSSRDGIDIVRPMLNVSRSDISNWCADNKIPFAIDVMNDDESFMRVKIRKNRHLLHDKLGITDDRILLAINNLARARDALESAVNKKLSMLNFDDGTVIFSESFLFDSPPEIGLKLLAELIRKIGGAEYPPRLKETENALYGLQRDTKFTLGGCGIRRLGNNIIIAQTGKSLSFRKKKI